MSLAFDFLTLNVEGVLGDVFTPPDRSRYFLLIPKRRCSLNLYIWTQIVVS